MHRWPPPVVRRYRRMPMRRGEGRKRGGGDPGFGFGSLRRGQRTVRANGHTGSVPPAIKSVRNASSWQSVPGLCQPVAQPGLPVADELGSLNQGVKTYSCPLTPMAIRPFALMGPFQPWMPVSIFVLVPSTIRAPVSPFHP